jgi:hypothetical protein
LGEGRAYWAKVLCAFCPTFSGLAKWLNPKLNRITKL